VSIRPGLDLPTSWADPYLFLDDLDDPPSIATMLDGLLGE
jgi:hypothetical protein